MKTITKALLCFFIAFFSLIFYSCKKDDSNISINSSEIEKKFFNNNRTSSAKENAFVSYLKKKNEKDHYVKTTVERIGLPIWNKSLELPSSAKNGNNTSGFQEQEGSDLYLIPFVREGDSVVNAIIIITTNGIDTSFQYLCDWQYDDEENTGLSTKAVALLLTSLDQHVFGERIYKVLDTTAFGMNNSGKYIKYFKPYSISQENDSLQNNLYYTAYITYCYNQWTPNDNGQLVGCPPGPTCTDWVMNTTCNTYTYLAYYDDGDGTGSGGTGTGGTGSGGSGNGGTGGGSTPPNCNPTPPPTSEPFARGNNSTQSNIVPECGGGWTPVPNQPPFVPYQCNYQLTQHEQDVFNQLDAEDDLTDQNHQNLDCKGTKRTGNIFFQGTKEHWLIQLDYVSKNPLYGEVEFAIPNSSPSGNRGYADIVNLLNKSIFEIKPNNINGQTSGASEVANYVAKANQFCSNTIPMGVPWSTGSNYTPTFLPTGIPNRYLKSQLYSPGVIVYNYENISNPNPAPPVVVPTTVGQKFKQLVERLRQNFHKADEIIAEYLQQNPDLVTYIKTAAIGAGVAIVVGTIIEDFITLGGGILDDWACFVLAYRVIRFAVVL